MYAKTEYVKIRAYFFQKIEYAYDTYDIGIKTGPIGIPPRPANGIAE